MLAVDVSLRRLTTDIDARAGTMLLFGLYRSSKGATVYRLPPGATPLLSATLNACRPSFFPISPGIAGFFAPVQPHQLR